MLYNKMVSFHELMQEEHFYKWMLDWIKMFLLVFNGLLSAGASLVLTSQSGLQKCLNVFLFFAAFSLLCKLI